MDDLALTARVCSLDECADGASAYSHGELPGPLPGFRLAAGPIEIVVIASRDGAARSLAAIRRCALPLLRGRTCRGVLVGPLTAPAGATLTPRMIERSYRHLLDRLLLGTDRAHVLSLAGRPDEGDRVDLLSRLAEALEARSRARPANAPTRFDLFMPGVRPSLAAVLAGAGRPTIRDLGAAGIRALIADRPRPDRAADTIVLTTDLRRLSPAPIGPPGLHFREVDAVEAMQRPLRYGLGLASPAPDPSRRRQFAATLGGAVVFRMAASYDEELLLRSAPTAVLERLARPAVLATDCFTEPSHRGRSIYPEALRWLAERSARDGARTLAVLVRQDNRRALRGAAKAGLSALVIDGEA